MLEELVGRAPSGTFDKPESTASEQPLNRAEDCRGRPSRAEASQPPSRNSHKAEDYRRPPIPGRLAGVVSRRQKPRSPRVSSRNVIGPLGLHGGVCSEAPKASLTPPPACLAIDWLTASSSGSREMDWVYSSSLWTGSFTVRDELPPSSWRGEAARHCMCRVLTAGGLELRFCKGRAKCLARDSRLRTRCADRPVSLNSTVPCVCVCVYVCVCVCVRACVRVLLLARFDDAIVVPPTFVPPTVVPLSWWALVTCRSPATSLPWAGCPTQLPAISLGRTETLKVQLRINCVMTPDTQLSPIHLFNPSHLVLFGWSTATAQNKIYLGSCTRVQQHHGAILVGSLRRHMPCFLSACGFACVYSTLTADVDVTLELFPDPLISLSSHQSHPFSHLFQQSTRQINDWSSVSLVRLVPRKLAKLPDRRTACIDMTRRPPPPVSGRLAGAVSRRQKPRSPRVSGRNVIGALGLHGGVCSEALKASLHFLAIRLCYRNPASMPAAAQNELAAVAFSNPPSWLLSLSYTRLLTVEVKERLGKRKLMVARFCGSYRLPSGAHIFDVQNVRTALWRSRHRAIPPGAVVAKWLYGSPPTKANRVQSPEEPLTDLHIVEIVPDDAAGWRVFSGFPRFPRPCIPTLLNCTYLVHTTILQNSSICVVKCVVVLELGTDDFPSDKDGHLWSMQCVNVFSCADSWGVSYLAVTRHFTSATALLPTQAIRCRSKPWQIWIDEQASRLDFLFQLLLKSSDCKWLVWLYHTWSLRILRYRSITEIDTYVTFLSRKKSGCDPVEDLTRITLVGGWCTSNVEVVSPYTASTPRWQFVLLRMFAHFEGIGYVASHQHMCQPISSFDLYLIPYRISKAIFISVK
ncbi:hypothetical protein PR048_029372 [Dryococelus australis]|uniref:Uncharacterized protein n=1 Tax=Dryococelus australis TaxID=614101 RepID=A0ABQ9GD97_9NEOP|nr:hypothetical protein PR048_029372 [Dryococelus australis]